MKKLILSSVVLLGLSGAAVAQTPMAFADVDTDGNGTISFTELQAVWPTLTQEEFDAADTSGTGELTIEQIATLQAGAGASATAPAPGGAGDIMGNTTGTPADLPTPAPTETLDSLSGGN
ncbi:EF-hand domain-containing protein [Devosia sp. PTR5]|jgi:hypothetical protein|uniref:EF-hand domain-containing protein n=1 Tax=Devosia oryzisoli TaxID=2774138 RepID=A0A927FV99_9HYPH|nr:EF-hand domain-containing protein [Devosia oryzisoli]MBD8066626.1 EF-hand domain-containing protein [Devosia oryzisoli]